jgi:MoxR-like ATPase
VSVEIDGDEEVPTAPLPTKVKLAKDAFYINSVNLKLLKVAAGMARDEGSANVLLVGPSGYGKTSLAAAFARMAGMEYVRFNCAVVRDPEEFFGIRGAANGTTTFTHTEFTRAVMAGNTVVCLDEVNRLEPWLLNALFPMLDDDRSTTIHGHTITVAPNTIFVMTMNQGYRYTGTFVIDAAFSNRAHMILKVGPMDANEETTVIVHRAKISRDVAAIIVKAANSLRKQDLDCDVSTRMTLNVARFTRYGLSVMEAFEAAIGNNASEVDHKRLIDAVKMAVG